MDVPATYGAPPATRTRSPGSATCTGSWRGAPIWGAGVQPPVAGEKSAGAGRSERKSFELLATRTAPPLRAVARPFDWAWGMEATVLHVSAARAASAPASTATVVSR